MYSGASLKSPQRLAAKIAAGLAGVLAALAMILPAPGEAAVGTIASYRAGAAYCWDNSLYGGGNKILTTSPQMDAAQFGNVGGGQKVGFRVTLEGWNETGRRWVALQVSRIKVHQQGPWGFYSQDWYDLVTGTQVSGLHQFPIYASGYYRVYYELFWFSDNGAVSGYIDTLPDFLRDERSNPPVLVNWCRY
jgi:hypothetical protein